MKRSRAGASVRSLHEPWNGEGGQSDYRHQGERVKIQVWRCEQKHECLSTKQSNKQNTGVLESDDRVYKAALSLTSCVSLDKFLIL